LTPYVCLHWNGCSLPLLSTQWAAVCMSRDMSGQDPCPHTVARSQGLELAQRTPWAPAKQTSRIRCMARTTSRCRT
jgi:hypothetical protein